MSSFGQALQRDALAKDAGTGTLAEAVAPGERMTPILVAEDNRLNGLLMVEQLQMIGFAAEIVTSGREALTRWRSGRYAALLTDIQMPGMDGYELAACIRSEEATTGARTPIIALTANAPPEKSARWKTASIDDYLMKPAELAVLKATLDRWLKDPAPKPAAAPPVAAQTSVSDEPVEPRTLALMVGDDPAVIAEFLTAFAASAETACRTVSDAIEASHLAEAGSVAHQLKSSARAIGAERLADVCEALESAAAESDGARMTSLQADLRARMRHVQDWIAARAATSPTGSERA